MYPRGPEHEWRGFQASPQVCRDAGGEVSCRHSSSGGGRGGRMVRWWMCGEMENFLASVHIWPKKSGGDKRSG